jgi:hypothetical protein
MALNDEPMTDMVAGETREQNESPIIQHVEVHVPGAAEGASATSLVMNCEFSGTVIAATYTPTAEVTQQAGKFRTFSVKNITAAKTIAKYASSTAALLAGVAKGLTLEAEAERKVTVGDVLEFEDLFHEATTAADTGGIIAVTIKKFPTDEGQPNAGEGQSAGYVGEE